MQNQQNNVCKSINSDTSHDKGVDEYTSRWLLIKVEHILKHEYLNQMVQIYKDWMQVFLLVLTSWISNVTTHGCNWSSKYLCNKVCWYVQYMYCTEFYKQAHIFLRELFVVLLLVNTYQCSWKDEVIGSWDLTIAPQHWYRNKCTLFFLMCLHKLNVRPTRYSL